MKSGVNVSLMIHPQVAELKRQNGILQREAARLAVEFDNLQYAIVPQIHAEYQSKIGALEWRVFQMEVETRAMLRRIETAQAMLNRGEAPCYCGIEQQIEAEFAAWRESVKQKAGEIRAAKALENLPTLTAADSRALQTLYRQLAFLLHPDITGKTDERRRKLWQQTTAAYKQGDLPTLQTIRLLVPDTDEVNESLAADNGLNNLENLQIRHTALKQICEKLLDEIFALKSAAPYIWHEILADETEIAKRQHACRTEIAELREKRLQLTVYWAEIMRFATDRDEVQIPPEPPDIFGEPADDWAEIIDEF